MTRMGLLVAAVMLLASAVVGARGAGAAGLNLNIGTHHEAQICQSDGGEVTCETRAEGYELLMLGGSRFSKNGLVRVTVKAGFATFAGATLRADANGWFLYESQAIEVCWNGPGVTLTATAKDLVTGRSVSVPFTACTS